MEQANPEILLHGYYKTIRMITRVDPPEDYDPYAIVFISQSQDA